MPFNSLLPLLLATQSSAIQLSPATAELKGANLAHDRPDAEPDGYLTGFVNATDQATFHFNASGGIYQLTVRYAAPNGPKGFGYVVNGSAFSGMFKATDLTFHSLAAGKVELASGQNTLVITKGWGYFDIAGIDLTPTQPTPPLPLKNVHLSDPEATPAAVTLYQRILNAYGHTTFSGQYAVEDWDYAKSKVGEGPAIFGTDLIDFSPTRVAHGSMPKGVIEAAINKAHQGAIVTVSWHWNAPDHLIDKKTTNPDGSVNDQSWYFGFYTRATTFDIAKTLANPDSTDYQKMISDIDAIAVQLKKLSDANVPILWRPLHEADGGWFWWGAKGPDPYKKLWRILYERLTHHFGLHNLIWVTSAPNLAWHPGDDVVDVIGADAYPTDPADPQSSTWELLQSEFAGRKPLALTEFGGVPDIDRAQKFGAYWSYFVSWSGDLGAKKMTVPELVRRYDEKSVMNAP